MAWGEKQIRIVVSGNMLETTRNEERKCIPNEKSIGVFLNSKTIGEAYGWMSKTDAKKERAPWDTGEKAALITDLTVCDAILVKQEKLREIEKRKEKERIEEEEESAAKAAAALKEYKEKIDNLPPQLKIDKTVVSQNRSLLEKELSKAMARVKETARRIVLIESNDYPVNLKKVRDGMTEEDKPYKLT